MVKFGKNKFKALNKIAKKQKAVPSSSSTPNKILKKKINSEKKVSFQKEVLIKEAVSGDSQLVKNVSLQEMLLNELSKTPATKKSKPQAPLQTHKLKPVKKQKQRQKMQINDTKLLLSLMKKK